VDKFIFGSWLTRVLIHWLGGLAVEGLTSVNSYMIPDISPERKPETVSGVTIIFYYFGTPLLLCGFVTNSLCGAEAL
jgi:hypothetical protein